MRKKCKRERLHLEGRRNTDVTWFMSFPPVHVCIGRLAWAATNELAPDSRASQGLCIVLLWVACLVCLPCFGCLMLLVFVWLVPASFIIYVIVCFWWLWSLPPQWCQELLQSGEDITEERPRPWHLSVVKSGYLSSLWCFQSFVHIRTFARNWSPSAIDSLFCGRSRPMCAEFEAMFKPSSCQTLGFHLCLHSVLAVPGKSTLRWLWEMTSLCKVHISSLRVWTLTEWRAVCSHAGKIRNFSDEAHLLEKKRLQDMKNLVVVDDNHKPVAVVCQVLLLKPTSNDYNHFHGESVLDATKADDSWST